MQKLRNKILHHIESIWLSGPHRQKPVQGSVNYSSRQWRLKWGFKLSEGRKVVTNTLLQGSCNYQSGWIVAVWTIFWLRGDGSPANFLFKVIALDDTDSFFSQYIVKLCSVFARTASMPCILSAMSGLPHTRGLVVNLDQWFWTRLLRSF